MAPRWTGRIPLQGFYSEPDAKLGAAAPLEYRGCSSSEFELSATPVLLTSTLRFGMGKRRLRNSPRVVLKAGESCKG